MICVKSFVSLLRLLYLGQTPKHPTGCEKKTSCTQAKTFDSSLFPPFMSPSSRMVIFTYTGILHLLCYPWLPTHSVPLWLYLSFTSNSLILGITLIGKSSKMAKWREYDGWAYNQWSSSNESQGRWHMSTNNMAGNICVWKCVWTPQDKVNNWKRKNRKLSKNKSFTLFQ